MRNIFTQYPGVIASISDQSDGNMSFTRPEPGVIGHRESFLQSLHCSLDMLTVAEQPHGTIVRWVDQADRGRGARTSETAIAGVEGMITREPGLVLGVTVADCVPIYLFEPVTKTIGLVHAGWRSAVAGVVGSLVAQLADRQIPLNSMAWYIGPHIQQCCFSVKSDIVDRFSAFPEHVKATGDVWHVSLAGILRQQLLHCGVLSAMVEVSQECTCHDTAWYSYRRVKGQLTGSQMAIISLRNGMNNEE